jgi:nitrate reductase alpha subunit
MTSDHGSSGKLSRRDFLEGVRALGFGALLTSSSNAWGFGATSVDNPLAHYPARDWEQTYRDLFKADGSFHFLCAPNDTHNCLLKAYVKNGVIVRIGPSFGYGKAEDLYGNKASPRWDPRCCQKGLALTRRFYGDRRVKSPMLRKGFKAWVDAGFPRDPTTGLPPREMFQRGTDGWLRVTWDEAAEAVAKTLVDVAKTYTGESGAKLLAAQHYEPETIAAAKGVGTQVLKFRGGMPLLGITRVFGMYRMANSMALVDAKIRGVGPDKAVGARGWDNYSWHTDLPPGHTMCTGTQTVEFDLYSLENAKLAIIWGMNFITTKMPDAHWLTEARLKGTRVVVIACEYAATSSKADDAIVCRPGTMPALALGFTHVILRDKLYDTRFVQEFTDLPLLVRMDTLQRLRAQDLDPTTPLATLTNFTKVYDPAQTKPPAPGAQVEQLIPKALREEWGDYMAWDEKKNAAVLLPRDLVGKYFEKSGIRPALEGEFEVTLADGKKVKVRPGFDLIKQYVMDNFSPAATEEITWTPKAAVEQIAKAIAENHGNTLFAVGMGPNQFFNNDLKDRGLFLLASLTGNIGTPSGNVGSYAGNYRTALFNGVGQWINENPFDIELDPAKPARPKQYWVAESAHYYNHEDHPLKVGKKHLTGKTHTPTPTKSLWFANANSILGNLKWHYNTVVNVLPRMEMIAVNEWWWSTSCEYADVVFAADSWAELKHPDLTASVTNPFLQMFPPTPLPRIHDTKGDIEITALVAEKLGKLLDEKRFDDYWALVRQNRTEVHIQRVLDASTSSKGYQAKKLIELAKEGIPALMMTRTSPRCGGFEQIIDSQPWYTKSGRIELYRDEAEFINAGENLPVHREPIDSTFYEPNVIVGAEHPCFRPEGPEDYGVAKDDFSNEVRQGRNVVRPWKEVRETKHPLHDQGYKFIFHTPKYRHGAHTTPIDTDFVAVLFGPFGDMYRRDKRMPFVSEGYVDIHPEDAKSLGVEDGDYVWVDADPEDRPYRGWKKDDPFYKVSRLMCRARYYAGTPRGVTRMWFNMYQSTPGSVKGHETRPDGLAKSAETNYQSMFRYGGHQSATRGWLKPTLMTDSLVRKELMGQTMGKGFLPDSHCPTGAPREAIVKITRAEAGGIDGQGLWRPAKEGLRPSYATEALASYVAGKFIKRS